VERDREATLKAAKAADEQYNALTKLFAGYPEFIAQLKVMREQYETAAGVSPIQEGKLFTAEDVQHLRDYEQDLKSIEDRFKSLHPEVAGVFVLYERAKAQIRAQQDAAEDAAQRDMQRAKTAYALGVADRADLLAAENTFADAMGEARKKGLEDLNRLSQDPKYQQYAKPDYELPQKIAAIDAETARKRAENQDKFNVEMTAENRKVEEARIRQAEETQAALADQEKTNAQDLLSRRQITHVQAAQIEAAANQKTYEAQIDQQAQLRMVYQGNNLEQLDRQRQIGAQTLKLIQDRNTQEVEERAKMLQAIKADLTEQLTTRQAQVEGEQQLSVQQLNDYKGMLAQMLAANQITREQERDLTDMANDAIDRSNLETLKSKLHNLELEHEGEAVVSKDIIDMRAKVAEAQAKIDITPTLRAQRDLDEAYKQLGVTGAAAMQNILASDLQAYGVIVRRLEAEKARLAAMQATGAEASTIAAQERLIADIQQDLEDSAKGLVEAEIKLREQRGESANEWIVALSNIETQEKSEKDRLDFLGNLYQDLQGRVYSMWDEWSRGFAKAITDGKKFGDTLMGVLHSVENQILEGIISKGLHAMAAELGNILTQGGRQTGGILGRIGGFLGGEGQQKVLADKFETLSKDMGDLKTAVKPELTDAIKNLVDHLDDLGKRITDWKPTAPAAPAAPAAGASAVTPPATGPAAPPAPGAGEVTLATGPIAQSVQDGVKSGLGELPQIIGDTPTFRTTVTGKAYETPPETPPYVKPPIAIERPLAGPRLLQQEFRREGGLPETPPRPAYRERPTGAAPGETIVKVAPVAPVVEKAPVVAAKETLVQPQVNVQAPAPVQPQINLQAPASVQPQVNVQAPAAPAPAPLPPLIGARAPTTEHADEAMARLKAMFPGAEIKDVRTAAPPEALKAPPAPDVVTAVQEQKDSVVEAIHDARSDMTGAVERLTEKLPAAVPATTPVAAAAAAPRTTAPPMEAPAAPAGITAITADFSALDVEIRKLVTDMQSFDGALRASSGSVGSASREMVDSQKANADANRKTADDVKSLGQAVKETVPELEAAKAAKTLAKEHGGELATVIGTPKTAGTGGQEGVQATKQLTMATVEQRVATYGSILGMTTLLGGMLASAVGSKELGRIMSIVGGAVGALSMAMKLGQAIGAVAHPVAQGVQTAAQTANTAAQSANTAAVAASTAADATVVASNTAVVASNAALTAAIAVLTTAVVDQTIATYATGFIPFAQHGAAVQRTGAAIIHSGEVVANAAMMKHIGGAMLDNIGAQLGAAPAKTGATVSFDGAVFHGAPSPQYVQSLMNNAVGQLRNSSRTWAFNPTGQ
jgi:hypothetical protein